MALNDDWRKRATPADEIPPGFVEFEVVEFGYMQVHVDAIAAYGPTQYEPMGFLIGTPLWLRGHGRNESTLVNYDIRTIAKMCLAAIAAKKGQ